MQTEEFMDESSDLLHWLDEVEAVLRPKDPSPADEDGIELLLERVTVSKQFFKNCRISEVFNLVQAFFNHFIFIWLQ